MENKKNTLCVGKLIKVRPEYEERYVIIHKHVWPEVLERIYKSNIRNYSIFMLDGILFSFNEYVGNNYEDDMNTVGDSVWRLRRKNWTFWRSRGRASGSPTTS